MFLWLFGVLQIKTRVILMGVLNRKKKKLNEVLQSFFFWGGGVRREGGKEGAGDAYLCARVIIFQVCVIDLCSKGFTRTGMLFTLCFPCG